jgi:hypothetical protein
MLEITGRAPLTATVTHRQKGDTMPQQPELFDQDASHDLDMVTLFSSSNHDAEMEANAIHGLLEANGIPSFVVGSSQLPVLEFHVEVPRSRLEEAQQVLAEAQEAGPSAAAEAEQATEETSH